MSGYDSRQVTRELQEREAARRRAMPKADATKLSPAVLAQVTRGVWDAYVTEVREWMETALANPGRFSNAAPWVELVGPEAAAAAALAAVSSTLLSVNTLTNVAARVGKGVRDELVWKLCREAAPGAASKTASNPARAGGLRKRLPVLARSLNIRANFPRTEQVRVGVVLVELLRKSTGLIVFDRQPHPTKKAGWSYVNVVHAAPEAETLMAGIMAQPIVRATHGPMIAPPLDWDSEAGGGRHTYPDRRIVKRMRRGTVVPPAMLRVANTLQRVSWRINPDVYWTLRRVWEGTARPVGHVPMREDLELAPWRPDNTVEERTRAAATIHLNRVARSKRLAVLYALDSCEQLITGGGTELWYPVQFDYRGRVYYDVSYLSPQGNDLERGLLRFAGAPKRLDAAAESALLIHAANMAGKDKLPYDERIAWSRAQRTDWQAIADNPVDNLALWETAEQPWQYLAAVLAAVRGDDGALPVYQDGTCNGLQVFALLLRDRPTAERVNVTPGPRPRDVYAEVAGAAAARLLDTPAGRRMHEWLGGDLPRSLVKRTVMTLPYGVTKRTAGYYLHDHLEEKVREGRRWAGSAAELRESTLTLADAVWDAVADLLPGAMNCRAWLEKVARSVGGPFYWDTPLGFSVWCAPERTRRATVATTVYGRRLAIHLKERTGKNDRVRQGTMMSPNFVHSLDATALHMAAGRALDAGHDWAGIHDCVGTRAGDYAAVGRIVRGAYADLFSKNLLEDLARQLKDRYAVTVPEPPPMGDLDPDEVRTSPYFFS